MPIGKRVVDAAVLEAGRRHAGLDVDVRVRQPPAVAERADLVARPASRTARTRMTVAPPSCTVRSVSVRRYCAGLAAVSTSNQC